MFADFEQGDTGALQMIELIAERRHATISLNFRLRWSFVVEVSATTAIVVAVVRNGIGGGVHYSIGLFHQSEITGVDEFLKST